MRRLTSAAATAATIASIASASPALAAIAPTSHVATASASAAYDEDTKPLAVNDTFTTTMNTPVTVAFTKNDKALAPGAIIAHASLVESVTNTKQPWNVPVPVRDTVRFVRSISIPGKGTVTLDSHFNAHIDLVKGYTGPFPSVTYKITDTEDNDSFATISGIVKPATTTAVKSLSATSAKPATRHAIAPVARTMEVAKPQRRAERHFRNVQRHKTTTNRFAR